MAEDIDEIDVVDLEDHGRRGTVPGQGLRYRIILDGQERIIEQHSMTVVELLGIAGRNAGEWALEIELHGGGLIRLADDDVVVFEERGVIEFRTIERHRHHKGQAFKLTVVVNGDPVEPSVSLATVLQEVMDQSLKLANAVGRPGEEWELRSDTGAVLELSQTIEAAGLKSGATLYLSLRAGAAGDSSRELLVDPAVSRAKFAEEVSKYRQVEDGMMRRGQWLVSAEFPTVRVLYSSPPAVNPQFIAFGAILAFDNYDLWAPSIRIANPFTWLPYKWGELPPQAALNRLTKVSQTMPNGQTVEVNAFQPMMQGYSPDDIPFLCMPGVREYHENPAHSGDPWLLRRGRGEGSMFHLLDVLHKYGAATIAGMQIQLAFAPVPL